MKFADSLHEHIAAAFTGLWVQSYEHEDALAEIGRLCTQHEWPLAVWDIDRGLQVRGQAVESAADPVAAIKSIAALAPNDEKGSAILVLPNFHRFIGSAEVVQALALAGIILIAYFSATPAAIFAIELYQKHISPYNHHRCPYCLLHGGETCSQYGKHAIQNHGLLRGLWMLHGRFEECHQAQLVLQKNPKVARAGFCCYSCGDEDIHGCDGKPSRRGVNQVPVVRILSRIPTFNSALRGRRE